MRQSGEFSQTSRTWHSLAAATAWACLFLLPGDLGAQATTASSPEAPWQPVQLKTRASLRGLHVFDEQNIWVSGTGGTIVNSTDGGKTWHEQIVAGAEALDFRDIQAVGPQQIVAITSGTPANIYRSNDGGKTWACTYRSADPKVFLDALSFWDDQHGVVMGDPVDGVLWLLETRDGGQHWKRMGGTPKVLPGEAGFAASGTNTIVVGDNRVVVALGGAEPEQVHPSSRILISDNRGQNWSAVEIPMARGPAAGIFSVCFADPQHGVVVGGDYLLPDRRKDHVALTADGGQTWTVPEADQTPSGYRSSVAASRNRDATLLVAVGPSGTDTSTDLGQTWQRVSDTGFHAVDFVDGGHIGWASGADGRLAKWTGIVDQDTRQP